MNKLIRRIIGGVPVLAMALAKLYVALPVHFLVYQPEVLGELKK